MTRRAWTPVGQQEATPHRQLAGRDRHEELYRYAVASRTHMWTVVVSHAASDGMLDSFDDPSADALPILDVDSMLGPPAIGCYVCEQTYEPRLRHRRCPGEPR